MRPSARWKCLLPVKRCAGLGELAAVGLRRLGPLTEFAFVFLGFAVDLVGKSQSAARYAGIKVKRQVMLTMAIAGAIAGLGGTFEVIGLKYRLYHLFSPGYGYDGIVAAFLAGLNPILVPISALFLSALKAGAQKRRPADGMTVHFVPGGPFLMGSPEDAPDALVHEWPQHRVDLAPFWLDQTEVTNAQYRLCVEAEACQSPVAGTFFDDEAYADHPVVYVTWDQASTYCAWLADETGWPVALPSEAQWEKAAAWDPQSWAP